MHRYNVYKTTLSQRPLTLNPHTICDVQTNSLYKYVERTKKLKNNFFIYVWGKKGDEAWAGGL